MTKYRLLILAVQANDVQAEALTDEILDLVDQSGLTIIADSPAWHFPETIVRPDIPDLAELTVHYLLPKQTVSQ